MDRPLSRLAAYRPLSVPAPTGERRHARSNKSLHEARLDMHKLRVVSRRNYCRPNVHRERDGMPKAAASLRAAAEGTLAEMPPDPSPDQPLWRLLMKETWPNGYLVSALICSGATAAWAMSSAVSCVP